MSNLVIDIGNSRTKLAIFDNRKLIKSEVCSGLEENQLRTYIKQYSIQQSIISSVKEEVDVLADILAESTAYIRFSAETTAGIKLHYKTPKSLGLDRLAGVIGARALYPQRNCLVIDSGTCITYDAVDREGVYHGGSISPGLHMRLRAMHEFTGRLPVVEWSDFDGLYGNDTATSMLSGVVNGTLAEVAGFIEKYRIHYPDLQVILCGGDSIFFDSRLKSSIFAHTLKTEPELVLIGLNEVIHQQ